MGLIMRIFLSVCSISCVASPQVRLGLSQSRRVVSSQAVLDLSDDDDDYAPAPKAAAPAEEGGSTTNGEAALPPPDEEAAAAAAALAETAPGGPVECIDID